MSLPTDPIVISDDSGDEVNLVSSPVPEKALKKPTRFAMRRQSIASPKKRMRFETPQPYGFLSNTQAAASTPRQIQRPITEFFASAGRSPARQTSISSFLKSPPRAPHPPPSNPCVVLPAFDDDGPLAPLPSNFIFRGSTPSPDIRMPTESSFVPDMNHDVVQVAAVSEVLDVERRLDVVMKDIKDVELDLGINNSCRWAGAMRPEPSPNTVHDGSVAQTSGQPGSASRKHTVWAAVSTIKNGPIHPHASPEPLLTSNSSAFLSTPLSPPPPPPPTPPITISSFFPSSPFPCESFSSSVGFASAPSYSSPSSVDNTSVPKSSVTTAVSASLGGRSASPSRLSNPAFAPRPLVENANRASLGRPSMNPTPHAPKTGSPWRVVRKTSCERCNRTFSVAIDEHSDICSSCSMASSDKKKRNRELESPEKSSETLEKEATPAEKNIPRSSRTNREEIPPPEAGGDSNEAATASLAKGVKKIKLYTPKSMSSHGSYSLKSVQDVEQSAEDQQRKLKERVSKADWRARRKEPAFLEGTSDGRIKCRAHKDPDCTAEECVGDFFDDWDYFEEGIVTSEEPRRKQAMFNEPSGVQAEQATAQPLMDSETLRATEARISEVTRDRFHRPYLTCAARAFLRHMGDWAGFATVEDKSIIHVDFTVVEAEVLRFHMEHSNTPLYNRTATRTIRKTSSWIEQPGRTSKDVTREIGQHASKTSSWNAVLDAMLEDLPGRTSKDVLKFVEDCRMAYQENTDVSLGYNYIKLDLENGTTKRPEVPSAPKLRYMREIGKGLGGWKHPRETTLALMHKVRDTMKPWKVFTEGSSDILDICWSPDGARFGLSCCTFDDMYNRPGNLMFGSLNTFGVKMLDGHKVKRPGAPAQAGLDPYLYSTVPSVKFSRDGILMFSGSYDKTVKVWFGEDGTFLGSVNVDAKVSHLATSPVHERMIAVACQNGAVKVLDFDHDGNLKSKVHTFRSPRPNLEAVKVVWCTSLRPNWLIAGYDTKLQRGKSGDLVIYDAVAHKVATSVMPATSRQFDIFLDEKKGMFTTAAVAENTSRSGKKVESQVRVYTIDGNQSRNVRAVHEFDSSQVDINTVTLSPCNTFVTASGTDGRTCVWDRRFPGDPLHFLEHGASLVVRNEPADETDDTGTTVALWGPNRDRIYTGSSDGVVKIWDVSRGNPFVRDFCTLDSQIMSAAFNPDFDMLMVGECSGKATLFSTKADEGVPPDRFNVDIRDVTVHNAVEDQDEEPQEESGVEAARELVRSGKMRVDGIFAWATGN